MRQIAEALREHVGNPSVPQEMLIETVSFLWVMVNMLAPQVMQGTAQSDHGDRQVLAYINQMKRNLEALGIEKPGQQVPSLGTYLEGKVAAPRRST